MSVNCLPHVLCCLTEHHFLYLISPPVLIAVNGERLVYPVLPPISWTSAPLPLQPLLQGWEQPHRTVSHQFCACRLLRTSGAAPAHCTTCRSTLTFTFPGVSYRQCSGRRHFRVCHFVSPSSFPLLCCSSFPFLHPFLFLSFHFFLSYFVFWCGDVRVFD